MDGQEAEEFVDEGVIRCICGTIEDDGFTIQCEKCFVWQHAICVDITQESVPDIYFCENCNPRQLDYEVRLSCYFCYEFTGIETSSSLTFLYPFRKLLPSSKRG